MRYGHLLMYKAVEFSQQICTRDGYEIVGTNFEIKIEIEEEKNTVISVFKPVNGMEAEFKGFKEKETPSKTLVGGFTHIERATDEVQVICAELKSEVVKRYGFDVTFTRYVALQYQQQMVNFNIRNFRIWIQIDDALVFIVIEATRDDGTLTLTKVL